MNCEMYRISFAKDSLLSLDNRVIRKISFIFWMQAFQTSPVNVMQNWHFCIDWREEEEERSGCLRFRDEMFRALKPPSEFTTVDAA